MIYLGARIDEQAGAHVIFVVAHMHERTTAVAVGLINISAGLDERADARHIVVIARN